MKMDKPTLTEVVSAQIYFPEPVSKKVADRQFFYIVMDESFKGQETWQCVNVHPSQKSNTSDRDGFYSDGVWMNSKIYASTRIDTQRTSRLTYTKDDKVPEIRWRTYQHSPVFLPV